MSKTLNECCFFQEGYVNPPQDKKEYFDGNIKWLRSLDLNNSFVYETSRTLTEKGYNSAGKSAYMFPANTIAISKSGTVGELGILKDTMCGNRAIIDIQVDGSKADLLYVFYLLRYKKKEIISKAVGSIQKNLYCSALGTIELCHDDINEQKRISGVLGSIDEKIRNNNTINDELETMAKTIYDYWFLQFEFPDENGKPYKSSGGKMVWCEELNREIPEGWKVGNLYDIADFINGLACQKFRPISPANKLPVVKIGEMHSGITDQTEYVRDDIPEKHIINDGDILFSWSATLETILWTGGKAGLNQHIFKVNPKGFAKYYVFMQLSAYIINFIRMAEARKTTMGHITTDHLKQSRIALPPKYIAQQYSNTVATMFQMVIKNNEQNRELASLRDFLLPLLMNGQVTFGDR